MASKDRCTSCGIVLKAGGTASFPCPKCGEGTIGRCSRCRDQSVAYVCHECGFEGP